jgi:hypothetical protein
VLAVVPRRELDFIAASNSRTFLLCVLLSPLAGGWFFIRRVPVPVAVVAVVVSCIAHANAEVVGSSAAWDALVGLLRHLVEVIRVRRRLVGARRGCGVEIRDEFLVVTLVVFHHLCALLLLLLVLVRCKQAVHRVRVVHQQVVREGAVEGLLGVEAVAYHGARGANVRYERTSKKRSKVGFLSFFIAHFLSFITLFVRCQNTCAARAFCVPGGATRARLLLLFILTSPSSSSATER